MNQCKSQGRIRITKWNLEAYPLWRACAAISALPGLATAEQDPCSDPSWNVTHERALFATPPESAIAGSDGSSAPRLEVDKLYEMQRVPQRGVTYAAAPERQRPVTPGYGGVAHIKIDRPGTYRVSLSQGLWTDMVAEGEIIASSDFQGRPGCGAPHKIVQYVLGAGWDLLLQLSGGHDERTRITITRSGDAP